MKKFFMIIGFLMVIVYGGCGNDNQSNDFPSVNNNVEVKQSGNIEKHIYDSAKIVDIKSGVGNNVLGKASILYMNSEDLTMEALEDWYFNYVSPNIENWNFAMIIYTDKPNLGVHCSGWLITKDVGVEKDSYAETWAMTGGPNGEYMGDHYIEDSNNPGHLKLFE